MTTNKIKVKTLSLSEVVTGKSINFVASCGCADENYIVIDDNYYFLICDATGKPISNINGGWHEGAVISVIFNVERYKAYLQTYINDVATTAKRGDHRPITSDAVYDIVEDIEAALRTI